MVKRMYCVIVDVGRGHPSNTDYADKQMSEAVRREFPDSVVIHLKDEGWRMEHNRPVPPLDDWGMV